MVTHHQVCKGGGAAMRAIPIEAFSNPADVEAPIPQIDPAHWRVSRAPTAFTSPALADETLGWPRLFDLFRQYGNFTMAYATLQPGMRYFESHDLRGRRGNWLLTCRQTPSSGRSDRS
jgi:hypothetical protein